MLDDHALYFGSGRERRRRRVSNSHPRVTFVSSMAPSAISFEMDIKSLRMMGSSGSSGRPTMWIASGTAALALLRVSVSSTEMVGVSSMYTSALQQQSTGGLTMVGRAFAYGMSSGRGESGGIKCCNGECVVRGSQSGKLIRRFARSVTLSDIVLQS